MKDKVTIKRVIIYLIFAFAITYLYEFLILFPEWKQIQSIGAVNVAPVMLFPALSVVITRLVTREGFSDNKLDPNFKKGKRLYYIFAWILPPVLTVAGVLIYFLIFGAEFSWEMEYYMGILSKQGADVSVSVIRKSLLSSVLSSLIFAPVLNVVTCFGEEWGWRGYLLPKLMKLTGIVPTLIISGIIWGLWHLPLTIMGHNYGTSYMGYPITGIIAMCLFCFVMGVLISYVTIKTGSVWPAVIAHGSLNGFASLGIYFTKDGGNPFVGPSITGIISGLPFIIPAVIAFISLVKDPSEAMEITEEKKHADDPEKIQVREAQMPIPKEMGENSDTKGDKGSNEDGSKE
ncbi:MAG: CPBP family intramembrane metalloprotease [Lachnospiraceae bacterium]|nr:CPBP family intramembrane metalloprotease [Lachnospiraceae bacterium]